MLAQQTLRLFAGRARGGMGWVRSAHDALLRIDPEARLLTAPEGISSFSLVEHLRTLLPDESLGLYTPSLDAQREVGDRILSSLAPETPVTLHLGYLPIAFATTLDAAWRGWESFHNLNSHTYNVCFYPPDMRWYVVRSGFLYLYPMNCILGEEPRLAMGPLPG